MIDSSLKGADGYYHIKRNFSWEGFCKVSIHDVLAEVGLSNTKIKKLFSDGAIKIMDTKVTEDGNHFEWYKRQSNPFELIEPNEEIFFGKHNLIKVEARPFSLIEKVYYKARDVKDKLQDKLEDRRIL